MQEIESTSAYLIAEGPEGLERLLNELYNKSQSDPKFASEEHYILYRLGEQKSLIKLDLSMPPFQFWYYDLWGRPATNTIKEIIANFLIEKNDEWKRHNSIETPAGEPHGHSE